MNTVNIEIFAQYIFSRISRRALDARKFDVGENHHQNRTNRINWYMRENLAARICLLMLDAQKFSCAKICTFIVLILEAEILLFKVTSLALFYKPSFLMDHLITIQQPFQITLLLLFILINNMLHMIQLL